MSPGVTDPRIGVQLRRLREQSGLSLRKFGQLIAYSHVYLWQIEAGERPAPADVIRRADDALNAGGSLTKLINNGPDIDPDDQARIAHVTARTTAVDRTALSILATTLDYYRRLEDAVGAGAVWGPVRAQHALAERLLGAAPSALRRQAADVVAQHARQAGWLTIATGRRGAGALFRQAAAQAEDAGLVDLAAMSRSYLGHLAWLAGRPAVVIEASRAARAMPAYVGEQAYDAYQEARGHAMRGDVPAVTQMLAEGRDLAAETAEHTGPIPAWQYYRTPAFFDLEAGLTLAVLARHGERSHAKAAVAALTAGATGLAQDQCGDWIGDYLVALVECHARLSDTAGATGAKDQIERIAARTGNEDLARRARIAAAAGR